MPRVTRDDVARRAGTSPAVVSYVLNNGPRPVAPATRERVLRAMAELGYRPNLVARALRARRTNAIGLVVPNSANPFFAELANSIEKAAFDRGLVLLLGNAGYSPEHEERYLETLANMRVEGVLLARSEVPGSGRRPVPDLDVPLVHVHNRAPKGARVTSVAFDNEQGAYLATRHLVEHGHREVACLIGPSREGPVASRARGWARALREAGLDPAGRLLRRVDFDRHRAYEQAKGWLAGPDRPRALFAATDEFALCVLRAATELGIRVPDELALIGFDGIAETAHTAPPLTTVRHPLDDVGRVVVETLLEVQRTGGPVPDVTLEMTLLPRRSCGCPGT